MKKSCAVLLAFLLLSLALSACGGSGASHSAAAPKLTAKQMADEMAKQVEQPKLVDLEGDMVKKMYHLDPALLEDYAIRTPLMNVKTNEIAILKVKDAANVPTVEAAVKQRASDVQKQFETYHRDQYENAKNYKLVTKDNYVLFLISENPDALLKAYDSFFVAK
ncbi:DUF4358 domain-containing protein [Cohnella nanjingensis]|uniref:DUF4358 domain-containing protein n=1 Tax=Cohnella nanjingensis TaxID=1387779 RepID=A0A7X0RQ01_9BACL|nr:DUF4358 domain-containing protein [Cohnella nanjingensis]MBB6671538.1 DUF4358 domain-containing protein [Cohnella nanjingensis]